MKRYFAVGTAALLVIGIIGCPVTPPNTEKDQFEVVRAAFADYFGSDPAGTISAADVFEAINDTDEANQPYVVSVRAADAYDIGHVPGAVNIPWRTIAQAGATTDLPTDRKIVVYCYTGHTGAVATAYLAAQGFDAVNMKFGMTAWTRDADVRVASAFDDATDSHDYAVETTDNPGTADHAFPVLDVTTSTDDTEIIRAAADAYLSAGTAPTISAADLFELLNDGDDSNDPVIVSVRAPDHYALGHIPGAINIPWKTIADENNLKKLPADASIVVYCYTGHTGGLATTALNVMGYHATNLKFGIMSWTQNAEVRVIAPFSDETDSHDYPVE